MGRILLFYKSLVTGCVLADKTTIPLSAGTHLGLLPVVAGREDGLAADSLAGTCTTNANKDGDTDAISI